MADKDNVFSDPSKYFHLQYHVTQCYTPELRKAERSATCCARRELQYWPRNKDIPVDHVAAYLLQRRQFTVLAHGNATAAGCAFGSAEFLRGVVPAVSFQQYADGSYFFEFAVGSGKKELCEYCFSSETGRFHLHELLFTPVPAERQALSLSQYLDKLPETLTLDEEMGKVLRKADVISVLEMVESGRPNWDTILDKLEKMLYSRCRPLEWPSMEMATPSTCPEGYQCIDKYDTRKMGDRVEIYYRTADLDSLPKYKRK